MDISCLLVSFATFQEPCLVSTFKPGTDSLFRFRLSFFFQFTSIIEQLEIETINYLELLRREERVSVANPVRNIRSRDQRLFRVETNLSSAYPNSQTRLASARGTTCPDPESTRTDSPTTTRGLASVFARLRWNTSVSV